MLRIILKVEADGQVELTEEIVDQVQASITREWCGFELDVDLSPKFVIGHVIDKRKAPKCG